MYQPNWERDGFGNLEGGIDSGNAPNIIRPNQAAFLMNGTTRGGFATCRPGFRKVLLNFPAEGDESAFKNGRFQGAHSYRAGDGRNSIITSIGGRIFRVNVASDNSAVDISISGDLNPSVLEQVWMEQAESWLPIQDGQSVPLIYNGANLQRSDLVALEVPIGERMAYSNGRLTVSKGREYVLSNLYGTPGGTAVAPKYERAVLNFDQNVYIAGGGAFSIPASGGGITGLIPIATPNTILGQGPLLVATPDVIFSNQVPIDRDTWVNTTYPQQVMQSLFNGSLSHEGMVLVNGDVWFRARDGVRSFRQALQQFGNPGNTPQSHEIERVIATEDERLLGFVSSAYFDNRLLMTAVPQRTNDHGIYFLGLHVLNFDGITSMFNKTLPAWEGLWTGLRFLRLVKCEIDGAERLFAFVLNDADEIELWEITKDFKFDEPGDCHRRIKWFLESRAMSSGSPWQYKQLEASEMWLTKGTGLVAMNLEYRPDRFPCWVEWRTGEVCSKFEWCPGDDLAECKTIQQYKEAYYPQLEFGPPGDICEIGANKPARTAYDYQVRLTFDGYCAIEQFRLYSSKAQKTLKFVC